MTNEDARSKNHWVVPIAVAVISSLSTIIVAIVSKQAPPNAALATSPRDIAGAYKIVGSNPNGSGYKGTLEIVSFGSGYRLIWNAAKQPYIGVGVKDENILSVGWGGNDCAVASYRIQPDGILDGKWTTLNQEEMSMELLVPSGLESTREITGKYMASGKDFNGVAYKEEVSFEKVSFETSGMLYKFLRSDTGYKGIALRNGHIVAVGFGPEACHVVSYKIQKDGGLTGVWGLFDGKQTGTEEAIHQ